MSENTDNNTNETPENMISIGDQQYSLEDLSSILNEHNELKSKFDPEVLEVGNYVREKLSRGPDGVKELREEMESYFPTQQKEQAFDFEIDEDNASANELKLMQALKYVANLLSGTKNEINLTKAELKKMVEDMTETAKLESTASAASIKVEAELGIKVTPAEIKEAIRKTGLKDPVDAVLVYRKNEVLKTRSPKQPKPNFVQEQSNKRIDLDQLSPMERIKAVREHPELLEGWKPKGWINE